MLSVVKAEFTDGKVNNNEVLLACFPAIIKAIDQPNLTVQVKFAAPSKPGRYTFRAQLKAAEFIGVDISKDIVVDVVATPKRDEGDTETVDDGDVVVVSPKSSLRQRKGGGGDAAE